MIRLNENNSPVLNYTTDKLLNRILNPICGITQEIGFIKRGKFGDRIIAAGAELTGIHHLLNKHDPGRGGYHTGGAGTSLNEAVIKSLGESIERYAQLVAGYDDGKRFHFASYNEMKSRCKNILEVAHFNLYADSQFNQTRFPFCRFDAEWPISWIKVSSIIDHQAYYLPAQFLLVGYTIKHDQGEPWYSTAVTTGTAAHTKPHDALLNALLEIIQIDSAMGHWYGNCPAYEIQFDARTKPFERLYKKYGSGSSQPIKFFWLKNPDLPGFAIACLLEKPAPAIPRLSVGLGASTSLNDALYKAYLEAIGVANLSTLLIFNEQTNLQQASINEPIYNIDKNVALYGLGYYLDAIRHRFSSTHKINATQLPEDNQRSPSQQLKELIDAFKVTNKQLFYLDLTNTEASELGIYVPRLWSPHTLSLCFPSAPPIQHSRFEQYGGFAHGAPHPYP